MTEIQFFAVAAKMRQAQKKYFSLSSMHPDKPMWLAESKRLEKLIDAEIKRRVPMIDVALLKEAFSTYAKDYTPQMKLNL